MKKIYEPDFLRDTVEFYYKYNPDTLMPLLMTALAVNGDLKVGTCCDPGATVFCSLDPGEVAQYDWVRKDPEIGRVVEETRTEGAPGIFASAVLNQDLQEIYDTLQVHDTRTVVQEFHHRIGVLVQHSGNAASERAYRQYAALRLAGMLAEAPRTWLKRNFLPIANDLLEHSGVQPRRSRMVVAEALTSLLRYNGKGTVYNPFAGCALAAAMLGAGDRLFADGDQNPTLLAAARLLVYGTGGPVNAVRCEDSRTWRGGEAFDFVLSTYLGYVDGKTAFDFCLGRCLGTSGWTGRYAGVVSPREFFENRSAEVEEAMNRGWISTIVLLPFGEVAVLVDASPRKNKCDRVCFYDMTHPMLGGRDIKKLLSEPYFARILPLRDVKKKQFMRELIAPKPEEISGKRLVCLKDYVSRIPRRIYDLRGRKAKDRVLAYINRQEVRGQMVLGVDDILRKDVTTLFGPAYRLTRDSLIVNTKGAPNPRLFDADDGAAFFQDGYAFALKEDTDIIWLMTELQEDYVLRQLHPYGMDEMLPEPFTEGQFLNLKLYVEEEGPNFLDDADSPEGQVDMDENADKLEPGTILRGNSMTYTIQKFLGSGFFGYAYSASAEDRALGGTKRVVLKEFFPMRFYHREGIRAVINDPDDRDMINENLEKFYEESSIMGRLGSIPDSHIVPALDSFVSEQTGTAYYVMPFIESGSLEDLQMSGFDFTEPMLIRQVVVPMCKALKTAHAHRVLHLDIKPENILVDANGEALLTDFGVANQYDQDGRLIERKGLHSASDYSAPEAKFADGGMARFGAQSDIFGLAATIFDLASPDLSPHPVMDFSEEDRDLRASLAGAGYTQAFADAVIAGLQFSATSRPKNAQTFLNLFPGYENMKI